MPPANQQTNRLVPPVSGSTATAIATGRSNLKQTSQLQPTRHLNNYNNSPLKQLPRSAKSSSIRDFEEYNGYSATPNNRAIRGGLIEDEVIIDEENPMNQRNPRRVGNGLQQPPSSSSSRNGNAAARSSSNVRRRIRGKAVADEIYDTEQDCQYDTGNGYGSYGAMIGGYGMSGYGMGGYGMGGYGMGYGMGGYGMGYGMMGMGGMMGPLAWISNINYMFMSLYQIVGMLGMNSHMIVNMFHGVYASIQRFEVAVRQSAFRYWLQQKSKKSKLLRFLFILASMALASQGARLIKDALLHFAKSYSSSSTPVATNQVMNSAMTPSVTPMASSNVNCSSPNANIINTVAETSLNI